MTLHFFLFFFFLMIRRPPRSTLFPYTTPSDLHNRGHGYSNSFDNPAGVYYFHTRVITYRLCTRHHSRGDSEDAHHNLYLIAHLVQESRLSGLVTTIVNPAGLPKWTQTMCAWCESRSRLSRSLTWLPGHNTYQNSKLLRHLDIEGDELVS